MATMLPPRRLWSWLAILIAGAVAGCSGEAPSAVRLVGADSQPITQLRLDPARVELRTGDTTIIRAIAEGEDSALIDVTNEVRWTSSDPASLTVKAGWLQVHKPGRHEVIVRHRNGSEGRASVDVRAAGSGSSVEALTLAAPAQAIPAGETIRLAATALLADGSASDVTSAVTWQVSPDRLAQIAHDGGLTAFDAGTVAVTATHPSGAQASLDLTIVPGSAFAPSAPLEIESIAISTIGSLVVGDSARLTVFGVRPDGTSVDVSDQVTWMPADGSALSVDGLGNVIGLVPGIGSITATYGSDLSASINIQVEEPSTDYYGSDPS